MKKTLELDITSMPFSRYGANVSIIKRDVTEIYSAIRSGNEGHLYNIKFISEGREVQPKIEALPSHLTFRYGEGSCRICICGDDRLSIESKGLDLILYPNKIEKDRVYGVKYADGHFLVTAFNHYIATAFVSEGEGVFQKKPTARCKKASPDCCCLRVSCVNGVAKVFLNLYIEQVKLKGETFDIDRDIALAEKEWEAYRKGFPKIKRGTEDFSELSRYTLWSSVVRKSQYMPYDAVLMSKIDMSAIWSWDHCFNALASAQVDFDFGLKQFLLPFEKQCENGALPDRFSHNETTVYGVTKPPIHGWCFGKLMDMSEMTAETLENVFDKLKKQLNWWTEYRDSDGDGICDYPQGCDSGLDNSSVFEKVGKYIEAPDLTAYLLLQYNTLIRINEKLGRATAELKASRDTLMKKYLEHNLRDGELVSVKSFSHTVNPKAKSIINLLPLVLGDILDKGIRDKLIGTLKADFLTENGIASESPKSKYYNSRGYWKGPIWAPTTYLITDGLRRAGETELAEEITKRYLNMAINKAHGNYENYDALKGSGLCVKGHTWTASVALLLMTD